MYHLQCQYHIAHSDQLRLGRLLPLFCFHKVGLAPLCYLLVLPIGSCLHYLLLDLLVESVHQIHVAQFEDILEQLESVHLGRDLYILALQDMQDGVADDSLRLFAAVVGLFEIVLGQLIAGRLLEAAD